MAPHTHHRSFPAVESVHCSAMTEEKHLFPNYSWHIWGKQVEPYRWSILQINTQINPPHRYRVEKLVAIKCHTSFGLTSASNSAMRTPKQLPRQLKSISQRTEHQVCKVLPKKQAHLQSISNLRCSGFLGQNKELHQKTPLYYRGHNGRTSLWPHKCDFTPGLPVLLSGTEAYE